MINLIFLLVVSLGLAFGSCPPEFEEVGGTCFYFSVDFEKTDTWDNAHAYCQTLGDLLQETINLAEVGTGGTCCDGLNLMETIASKGGQTWLGATDKLDEANWIWQQSGNILNINSSFWYPSEPNARRGQNCLSVYLEGDYSRAYFFDYDCYYDYLNFICQIF
ncbi:unnamed protein product [Meganyctiphanes norvegica]|uniref:C-type lectin domain-containing protein n=1 Tax=Meganyctiphanes norvegica TaxID=48144 RepID=A0AAV2RDM7_MEGNR